MDHARFGYARFGYARFGVYRDDFNSSIKALAKNLGVSLDVTLHSLELGAADPTTGWFDENFSPSTIPMLIIPKSSQKFAISLGSYVRTDALGLTQDVVKRRSRVEQSDGTLYLVTAVRDFDVGDSFDHRKCDLEKLELYREGS